MPGKIALLSSEITNKIAAGEVVERPASILKELLENALDAGATDIVVSLESGTGAGIRVVDNGEGMEPVDVPLAFQRYATSKIRGFDDIYAIRSFGFRGEALPSIASVARVEMLTRRRDAPSGTRAIVEGGEIRAISDAGCPAGTSFLVDKIFDAVPVRRKFLKAEAAERGFCFDVITQVALARPEIKVRVVSNGREMMNLPATSTLAERIAIVLGADLSEYLVPVRGRRGAVAVEGMVSTPAHVRSTGKHMFVYVNRRFVRDQLVNHAVMTAYRHLLQPRKYPLAVLFIDLPPGEVDVNVHPAKREVRFRSPRTVYETVLEALVPALAGITPHTASADASGPQGGHRDVTQYRSRVEEALKRYAATTGSIGLFSPPSSTTAGDAVAADSGGIPSRVSRAEDGGRRSLAFSELHFVGQIGGTYLIFAVPDGMVLLDQHAAHERVLFERLRRTAPGREGHAVGQRLLVPEVITLAPRDLPFVTAAIPLLKAAGMEIEPFGGDAVVVKSLPAMLTGMKAIEVIQDLLDGFTESDRLLGLKEREERIYTFIACHGAVKAGNTLTAEEVNALCRDLDATPFTGTCPHGRPLFLSFSLNDLEKMFRRR